MVHEGERLDVTLEPLGSGRLREIGRVVVDGRLAVPRSTVPTREITRLDLDANGYDRILDALATIPSLNTTRPDAGTASATAVVSLRGPDPSETRIALDGQTLNNANTGDLDLASFPSSVLSAIDVSEGLGPEDPRGADTIGGEINLVSLRPTATPQRMVRLSAGSFGTTSAEINATGRLSRFGYALALGSAHSAGYVHDYPVTLEVPDGSGGTTNVATRIGSATSIATSLVNLSYDLSPRSTLRVRSLSVNSVRDEGAAQTAPVDPARRFTRRGVRRQRPRDVGAEHPRDAREPHDAAGRGDARDQQRSVEQRNGRDAHAARRRRVLAVRRVADRPARRRRPRSGRVPPARRRFRSARRRARRRSRRRINSIATLHETGTQVVGPRGHRRRAAVARSPRASCPRIGRRSAPAPTAGSGSRTTTVMPARCASRSARDFARRCWPSSTRCPSRQLSPDQNCVGTNGNRNERAEHATEYELGYGKRLGATTVDATLYRTNLRDPIEKFYPLGTACPLDALGNPISTVVAQSFPVNVGNVVYQGGTLRLAHRFGALVRDRRVRRERRISHDASGRGRGEPDVRIEPRRRTAVRQHPHSDVRVRTALRAQRAARRREPDREECEQRARAAALRDGDRRGRQDVEARRSDACREEI